MKDYKSNFQILIYLRKEWMFLGVLLTNINSNIGFCRVLSNNISTHNLTKNFVSGGFSIKESPILILYTYCKTLTVITLHHD